MTNIVVAIDHNDETELISNNLNRLSCGSDSVTVLGIAPRLSAKLSDHKFVSSAKRAEQALLRGLTEKADEVKNAAGVKCDIDLVSGAAAQKIIETAILRNADLIIKEDDGLNGSPVHRVGKTARTLVKRSPSATLILRKSIDRPAPRIALAIDNPEDKLAGAERSLLTTRVFQQGVEIAKRLGASEITLLHVWTTADLRFLQHPRSGLSEEVVKEYIERTKSSVTEWIEAFRQEANAKYADNGLSFKTHLVFGEGGKVLAQAADDLDADLLVIGSANRRGVQSLFFGNTAEDVLNAAACNLLVVKPADFQHALPQ